MNFSFKPLFFSHWVTRWPKIFRPLKNIKLEHHVSVQSTAIRAILSCSTISYGAPLCPQWLDRQFIHCSVKWADRCPITNYGNPTVTNVVLPYYISAIRNQNARNVDAQEHVCHVHIFIPNVYEPN